MRRLAHLLRVTHDRLVEARPCLRLLLRARAQGARHTLELHLSCGALGIQLSLETDLGGLGLLRPLAGRARGLALLCLQREQALRERLVRRVRLSQVEHLLLLGLRGLELRLQHDGFGLHGAQALLSHLQLVLELAAGLRGALQCL